MLKKTINYVDFDNEPRSETFYFNLTKAELMDMELSTRGGLEELINRIVETRDTPELIALFRKLIDMSYGEKSADGKYFRKTPEILESFKATNAYSELYMELVSDDKAAADFVYAVLPADLREAAMKEKNKA